MTNEPAPARRRACRCAVSALLGFAALAASSLPGRAAEPAYPFEGTWVRANRACTATAPLARTYTVREVTSAVSHCAVRKIASGSGLFEIFEECRRGEHPGNFTETIRMQGADAMVVRRQAARLKIARPLRFIRCTLAAPGAPPRPVSAPHRPAAAGDGPEHGAEGQTAAPKPAEPPKP